MATILFDGVCVLCSRSYGFVSARDRAGRFRFVAIQEPEGREIAAQHKIDPDDPASFVLIDQEGAHLRSEAVLRILAALPGWGWVRLIRLAPRRLRDRLYDLIARNRYRWFGKRDVCLLPPRPSAPSGHGRNGA